MTAWTPATWQGATRISIFADLPAARSHLCHHVLPSAETYGWRALSPALYRILPEGEYAERERHARQVWSDFGLLAKIYAPYATAVGQAMTDAMIRKWTWPDRECDRMIGLGLSGIVVVWNRFTVISAYLAAFGYRDADASEPSTHEDPLPRDDRGAMHGSLVRDLAAKSGSPEGRHQVRFLLFRKAVEVVSDRLRRRHQEQSRMITSLITSWDAWLADTRLEDA